MADPYRHHKQLDEGASDLRLIGILFTALGAVLMIPLVMALRYAFAGPFALSSEAILFVAADMLILMGPGAWYLLAAARIRRLNRRALQISTRVAIAQMAAVAVAVPLALLFPLPRAMFVMPALAIVFFIPALLALMYVLRRLYSVMNRIGPEGHGFDVVPTARIAPPDTQPGPPAAPADQPIDNPRGK